MTHLDFCSHLDIGIDEQWPVRTVHGSNDVNKFIMEIHYEKLVLAGAFAASMVGTTSSAQGALGASSLVNMLPLVIIVATVGLASSSGT